MRVSNLEGHAALDDEREVILAVMKGDEAAFARLIALYSPMIYGFLKRMLFSKEGSDRFFRFKVHLRIPKWMKVDVENEFGECHLSGCEADISCENEFTQTTLAHTRGELNISNEFGALTINDHQGMGKIEQDFGEINIVDWIGPLNLDVEFGSTSIKTTQPNFRLTGKFEFGKTDIFLPKDFAGTIEVSSEMGSIQVPAGLSVKKEMLNQRVKGSIGEGDGAIKITSEFAPVSISIEK